MAALAAFIGWLAGSVLLMAIRTSEPTWRTHTHLLVVSTFMALAFLPLLAWNAMTLPLPWTQVCATKTVAGAEGWNEPCRSE